MVLDQASLQKVLSQSRNFFEGDMLVTKFPLSCFSWPFSSTQVWFYRQQCPLQHTDPWDSLPCLCWLPVGNQESWWSSESSEPAPFLARLVLVGLPKSAPNKRYSILMVLLGEVLDFCHNRNYVGRRRGIADGKILGDWVHGSSRSPQCCCPCPFEEVLRRLRSVRITLHTKLQWAADTSTTSGVSCPVEFLSIPES